MELQNEFIIFDTEYTSWKGSQERKWKNSPDPNITEYQELVMIGALKIKNVNCQLKIIDKIEIYVKPKINFILSNYFIDLTNITQETIDKKGKSFDESLEIFYNFCKGENNNFLRIYSYGNDYEIIDYNLKLYNYDKDSKFYFWKDSFFDIKDFFIQYINVNNYTSGTVVKAFNIKDERESNHNSLWDSISIFLSLKYIYENYNSNFIL